MKGCSDCCIEREYYPTEKFGRIGVLLLPFEKQKMQTHALKLGLEIRIIPRLAVIRADNNQANESLEPEIIAFQMMGSKKNGTICPFLDTENSSRSPHGGFLCKIYDDRPLACRAYPVISTERHAGRETAMLDNHCAFCRTNGTIRAKSSGVQAELEALAIIKSNVTAATQDRILRYATATGEEGIGMLPEGWVAE